ncbi:hypothetical protein BDP55DRAFT_645308 [Colletotrichum godetiae]|uniref:Secreted protein n=1 Tax=Colletotrichum godetiae TaxID=1209918 RepID=A0AAJ0AY40_9PEZI|nr:uncharacterized protein BDP55DRAFT_645308 [Colletotrichum godetiae]KAK1699911.1 hypothetical protein BDP55DRAFT_645308 [Colletotrichum godetiae]
MTACRTPLSRFWFSLISGIPSISLSLPFPLCSDYTIPTPVSIHSVVPEVVVQSTYGSTGLCSLAGPDSHCLSSARLPPALSSL